MVKPYKYQTVFMIPELDSKGQPVKFANEKGQMRTNYINVPTIDLIPDMMHRTVTQAIYNKLESDGQVKWSDIKEEVGMMFDAVRIDYVKRWIQEHSSEEGQAIELISVNSKYWTSGKGSTRSDDLEITASYLAVNGRDKQGWVASGEGEEGNQSLTRARIKWQGKVIDGLLTSMHNKLAPGSGMEDQVRAVATGASNTLKVIE